MTYTQMQAARTAASLKKLTDAAIEPITNADLAISTGFHPAYIRKLLAENDRHFVCVGLSEVGGEKRSKLWQCATAASDMQIPSEMQPIYYNPYDQLTRTPDFIKRQFGQSHAASLVHNARASNKSPRVFAGGGVLA